MKLSNVAALHSSIKLDAAEDVATRIAMDRAILDRVFPCSYHTPLSLAASEGNVKTLVRLLELGAAPQPAEDRPVTTPLHEAARRGDTLSVLALLEAGASPTLCDVSGLTALDLAAERGHIDAIRSMILEITPRDRKRHDGVCAMALCRAAQNGRTEMVDYLQRLGIPINAFAAISLGDLRLMTRPGTGEPNPLEIRHPNYRFMLADGPLPIHYAAAEGNQNAVLELLRRGADPSARTTTGLNALAVSAIADVFAGRSEKADRKVAGVVRRKLGRSGERSVTTGNTERAEAVGDSLPFRTGDRHVTAILLDCRIIDTVSAVALKQPDLLEQLAHENSEKTDLVPALCLACWLGAESAAATLLRHGVPANCEVPGRPGATTLRLVAQGPATRQWRRVEPVGPVRDDQRCPPENIDIKPTRGRIAELLLDHGARDPHFAALTDAIKGNMNEVAVTMLRHPDYRGSGELDLSGRATATAIVLSNAYLLDRLLKHGADPNRPIADLGGMLPLHAALAFHGELSDIYVRCLLGRGARSNLKDPIYGAKALSWAKYGCYPSKVPPEIRKYLADPK